MSVDTGDSPTRDLRADSGPGGGPDPYGFGAAMGRLASALQDRHDNVDDVLQEISSAAVLNVPGAESAGITLVVGRKRLENRAATDDLPKRVADLQTEVGEGPCLQCLRDRQPIRVPDMAADLRWPAFVARMAPEPVASMLSAPLVARGEAVASLSLYASTPGAFDEHAQEVVLILASHAAAALVGARSEINLRQALDNRDVIGQAKGILMERHKITAQQAFLILVQFSQARNVKLADIAADLTATGSID